MAVTSRSIQIRGHLCARDTDHQKCDMTLTLSLEFADYDPQEGVMRRDVTPSHRHDDSVWNPTESNEAVCVCVFVCMCFTSTARTHGDLRHKSSFRWSVCVVRACACACPVRARVVYFPGSTFPPAVLTRETGAARGCACGGWGWRCGRTRLTDPRARVETRKRHTHRMSKPHVPLIARAVLLKHGTVDAVAREPTADNQWRRSAVYTCTRKPYPRQQRPAALEHVGLFFPPSTFVRIGDTTWGKSNADVVNRISPSCLLRSVRCNDNHKSSNLIISAGAFM